MQTILFQWDPDPVQVATDSDDRIQLSAIHNQGYVLKFKTASAPVPEPGLE